MQESCGVKKNHYIPHSITISRIIFTILFLYVYFLTILGLAIIIFSIAVITDIIDGIIARKLNVCSSFGSYFDVLADFLLIFFVYISFVINGLYPFWLLILIGFMFIQFIITSRLKKPIYDPVGKYIFIILIIMVFITFISSESPVCNINCFVFLGFSTISLVSRFKSLKKSGAKIN
ncbi:MAG: CDP-alcohol phosphatidyltransferase family protein [Promethearchaeota archaeon]